MFDEDAIQNNGGSDGDGNGNSDSNLIGTGDSGNNDANTTDLAARDCIVALAVSVG